MILTLLMRWWGPILCLILALPPIRSLTEGSMTLQMLVQLPLLVVGGLGMCALIPVRSTALLQRWNHNGIGGLLVATFTSMVWMLPSMMDTSVISTEYAIAKFITMPMLVGLPLGISWKHMNFVVRAVFMVELTATCFRLGWLYLISPSRICNMYLLGDQQQLGTALIAIGFVLFVFVAWKLLWGRLRVT